MSGLLLNLKWKIFTHSVLKIPNSLSSSVKDDNDECVLNFTVETYGKEIILGKTKQKCFILLWVIWLTPFHSIEYFGFNPTIFGGGHLVRSW